jgi:hypothetical protein
MLDFMLNIRSPSSTRKHLLQHCEDAFINRLFNLLMLPQNKHDPYYQKHRAEALNFRKNIDEKRRFLKSGNRVNILIPYLIKSYCIEYKGPSIREFERAVEDQTDGGYSDSEVSDDGDSIEPDEDGETGSGGGWSDEGRYSYD